MAETNPVKLKSLEVYRFNDVSIDDMDEAAGLQEALKVREVDYDAGGRVIKETEYMEDGRAGEVFVRIYNDKGNIVELHHYFEEELSEKTIYEYDGEGLLSSEKLQYADGGVLITHYLYDGNKNIVEKKILDGDGSLDSLEVFRYDGKKLMEHYKYSPDNDLRESRRLVYRADNPDLLQEEYNYEAEGNIELKTIYLDNESGSVTYNREGKVHTRQKVAYDEKKRMSEMLLTTYSGTYHYQYNYDEHDNVVEEVRTVGNTVFFRAEAAYNEYKLITARSVTEMNSGLFTDIYQYKFFEE